MGSLQYIWYFIKIDWLSNPRNQLKHSAYCVNQGFRWAYLFSGLISGNDKSASKYTLYPFKNGQKWLKNIIASLLLSRMSPDRLVQCTITTELLFLSSLYACFPLKKEDAFNSSKEILITFLVLLSISPTFYVWASIRSSD